MSAFSPAPRVPLEPLERVLGTDSLAALATALGGTRGTREYEAAERTLCRARREGGITVWKADEWACRLGLHASNVWGDEWWAACADADDGAAA